jgi:hypothetical protein
MHCNLEADREMMNAARALLGRRPWMPLLSAVLTLGEGQAELIRHAERPWTSVTFAGTRHTIVLAFTGPEGIAAGEAFIALLPDHEFAIPRQIVADASVVRVEHDMCPKPRLIVEAELLLVEDC